MPRINQEEYEVLKELDNKWKWIARDEDGDLYAYDVKPGRLRYMWFYECGDAIRLAKHEHLFRFIQWEDEEPYNIQELIEEYEHESFKEAWVKQPVQIDTFNFDESEETEVKSIQDLIDKWDNYKNVARTVANSRAIEHADMFINDLEQLDEPEVLSQELPVIPRFVAEYLDFAKSDVPLMRVLELANTRNELPKWEKEYDWISANDEKFARAWLDGYEVAEEREQKYRVIFPSVDKNGKGFNYLAKDCYHKELWVEDARTDGLVWEERSSFTEDEIRDLDKGDILFEHFAVSVEELEE